jgi:Putative peptidoglycan binding domain
MTSFEINGDILQKLFKVNQFVAPEESKLIFVGIRGCLPADTQDNNFKTDVSVNIREIDYKNLRCCFLQWKIDTNEIAAFAGSTVPSYGNIIGFRASPLRNSNCLTPGFYKNYVKGKHRPAKTKNWHDAFRQNGQPLAIRRTFDNTYYDNFDEIQISTGCDDNMHAGWTLDEDSEYFSSAGCQVIMGIPLCEATASRQTENLGPWRQFKQNGYTAEQPIFPYALFNSAEIFKVVQTVGKQMSPKLKFGSSGPLVNLLQVALIQSNYLSGTADGDFGVNTFNAVKKFQADNFGKEAVDCIVGPVTAQALGIDLSLITL